MRRVPQIRTPWRAAGVIVGLIFGSGCLLFVKDDPSSLGTTCHVQNEGSQCGKCITKNCQPKLDACCGDATCAPTLDALDACIGNFGASCGSYAQKPASTASRADDLRACVAGCADTCRSTSGSSITFCSSIEPTQCDCTTTSQIGPNDTVCSTDTVPNSVCCAAEGWPNTGLTCSCQTYDCRTNSSGRCSCGLTYGSNTGVHVCTATPGTYCCDEGYQCTCGLPMPCTSPSKMVPSCTAETAMGCSSGRRVTSCSANSGSRVSDAGGHG